MGGYCCSGTGGDVCGGRGCGAEGCGASDASGEVNGRVSSSSSGAMSGGTDGSRSIPVCFASCWWAAGRCFESRFSRASFRVRLAVDQRPFAAARSDSSSRATNRRAAVSSPCASSGGLMWAGQPGIRRGSLPYEFASAMRPSAVWIRCSTRFASWLPRATASAWWRGDWTRERPRRSCSAIRSWGGAGDYGTLGRHRSPPI